MQRAELKLQRQEIRMQRSSLDLQREELRQTRKELHDQTLQFAAQNRTLSQQTADNTFFQLLRLHNEIVGAIDLVDKQTKQPIAKGRDCFQTFVLYLKRKYSADSNRTLEQTVNSYVQFYQEHQADLGHYFRSLYNIVKFVDRTDFDDKRRYTNLVRAQLSSYEQVLLFYNCLSALGAEKFKPLVEEYALLKHIPRELLVHEGKSLLHYAGRAYG